AAEREGARDDEPQEWRGATAGQGRAAIRAEFFGLPVAQHRLFLLRGSQVLPAWRAVLRAGYRDREGRKERSPADRHGRADLPARQGGGSAKPPARAALC